MQDITMSISGMSCGGCVSNVRKALANVDGVTDAQVTVGAAVVTYEPARTNPAALRKAIVQAGFDVAMS